MRSLQTLVSMRQTTAIAVDGSNSRAELDQVYASRLQGRNTKHSSFSTVRTQTAARVADYDGPTADRGRPAGDDRPNLAQSQAVIARIASGAKLRGQNKTAS